MLWGRGKSCAKEQGRLQFYRVGLTETVTFKQRLGGGQSYDYDYFG